MRKFIKVCLYCIIFILLLTTCVRAEDEACKITLSANKKTLSPGDEVTITLTMSDITKTSGIVVFSSVLEYDNDIFEIIPVDDEELKADLENEFADFDILYNGENDATVTNPWYLLYIESDGSSGIYGSTMADPQIQQQVVGKIKLKVKEDAISTSTIISLQETEAYDSESISDTEDTGDITGYEIAESEIDLKIEGSTAAMTPTTQENVNKQQITQTQLENKAQETGPYTGIEDYIPFILIVAVIAIVSYIKYKKYKEI